MKTRVKFIAFGRQAIEIFEGHLTLEEVNKKIMKICSTAYNIEIELI